MHKTAPTTGTGWSVGLMLAIALFGISSSVFVLRSNPAPSTAASATASDVAQAYNSEKLPASEVLPASAFASNVTLTTDAAAPAASDLAASIVSAAPAKAPTPSGAATRSAQATRPVKTVVRKPAQREPVPVEEGVTEGTAKAQTPLARPATLLPLPRAAKVREFDQASPSAGKTEPSAKSVASSDTPKAASLPVETKPSLKQITAEPLVKTPFKPVIVMATETKVWVRVTDQQTLIFEKGQNVPSFGVFKESDGKSAKFDTGTFPVNPTE